MKLPEPPITVAIDGSLTQAFIRQHALGWLDKLKLEGRERDEAERRLDEAIGIKQEKDDGTTN